MIAGTISIPTKVVYGQENDDLLWIRKADKILGIASGEDDTEISDSDAEQYQYQMSLQYPAWYLMEDAKTRFGYESLMDIRNKINDDEYRGHPEYYYEAALMAVLFEQSNNQSLLEGLDFEFAQGVSEQTAALLGYDTDQEIDALEELKKLKKSDFTKDDYLDSLKADKNALDFLGFAERMFDLEEDLLTIVLKTQMYQKVLTLQEETITFLGKMGKHASNEEMKTAINTVRAIYIEQQENPDAIENSIIATKVGELDASIGVQNLIHIIWNEAINAHPVLKGIKLAAGITEFVNSQLFCADAISGAYANLSAIAELENAARLALLDAEEDYKNATAIKATYAGIFNAGWDLFTALTIADCEAAIAYADTVYQAGIQKIVNGFSGSKDYDEFVSLVKNYQSGVYIWREKIQDFMESQKSENRKVDGAVFKEGEDQIKVGEQYSLSMQLSPVEAADQYVSYTSSDTEIVEINGNQAVGKKEGTVTITGRAGEIRMADTMTLTVVENDDPQISGEFRYKVLNNSCIIITKYIGTSSKVQIPDTIDGLPVQRIESFTGQDGKNETITEVVLSDNVTQIGEYAFYRCEKLEKINLEEVKTIKDYAFASCSSLKKVSLTNAQTLGIHIFDSCTSLKYLRFPTKLDTIPEGTCRKCSSLTEVVFPKNLETIKYWAFWGCGFKELEIPAGTVIIEASAIWKCPNLKILKLPGSIGLVDEDPVKFLNNDDTVYYAPEISYMYRMFQYWETSCNVKFNYKKTRSLKANAKSYTIYKGKTKTIKYSIAPKMSDFRVTYKSSNTKIATVSSKGVVTGKKKGTATITLTGSNGQKATCKVIVKERKATKISKVKSSLTIKKGKTAKLSIKLTPKNTTDTITWKSGNKKIATVSKSGVVTGVKKGKTTVTARIPNGKKVVWKVTVTEKKATSIRINVKSKTLNKGKKYTLKATCTPKGATDQVYWKSSNKKVATVSSKGVVTAVGKGTAVITATVRKKKATCKITVKVPVTKLLIQEESDELEIGTTMTLKKVTTPTNTTDKITWKSSDSTVASVTASGVVTGKKLGKAVISLCANGMVKDKIEITVYKKTTNLAALEEVSLKIGSSKRISVTRTPADATDKITWKSSNLSVAEVSSAGTVTGKAAGTALITAATNHGAKAFIMVFVEDEEAEVTTLMLSKSELEMTGEYKSLMLPEERTIDVDTEEIQIEAQFDDFQADFAYLTAEINTGNTYQTIRFSSSDEDVVRVRSDGKLEARYPGTATITARTSDGSSASCKVTVSDALNLKWQSSDEEIVNVTPLENSSKAKLSAGEKAGLATVMAIYGELSKACKVTVEKEMDLAVTPKEVSLVREIESLSLGISAENLSLKDTVILTATPKYKKTQAAITAQYNQGTVQWESDHPEIAALINGMYDGTIRGMKEGEAVITATDTVSGKSDSAHITVTNETAEITWSSSNEEVLELIVDGWDAQLVAKGEGTAVITAKISDEIYTTYEITLEKDPVSITSVEELKKISEDLDGTYVLENDLDLEETWTAIGTAEEPFTGTFDGNGHTITGLKTEDMDLGQKETRYYGLFGCVGTADNPAEIKNLTVDGEITITDNMTAGSKNIRIGGICGNMNDSKIINCHNLVDMTIEISLEENTQSLGLYAGGIAGGSENGNSIIENCSNSGSIWLKASGGKSEVLFGAGIIANVYSAGNQLIGCKNEADITVDVKTAQDHGDYTQYGKAYAGGIAADIYGETVSSCSNTGTIGCYGTVYPEDGEIGAYCIAGGIVGRKSSYGVTIADDNINSGTVEAVSGNTKKNEYVGDIFGASGQQ